MRSTCKIRVRYGETDQMGVVYYGNYSLYLEEARTELLRETGNSYADLEKEGIMLPVIDLNIEYKGAAAYDDLLELRTGISFLSSRKVSFYTEIFNFDNLICKAQVSLVFMNKETRRVCSAPKELIDLLTPYIVT